MARTEKTSRIVLILASVALTLIGCEIILHLISHTDSDGNIHVMDRRLRPFQFPTKSLEAKIEQFKQQETSYTQYDPDLGWAVRPNSQSGNGLYFSNSAGIRTAATRQETPPKPTPGTLRIAIFGDSFTHGDEVPYEESWGAVLEQSMKAKGQQVEVINFGGQGYAIDQAFLRWRKHGKSFKPHIVIFGFQNSNVKRSMNLIRLLYSPDTGVIFSKPRFILENDALHLINVPTATPQQLLAIFNNFEHWELKDHEFFYQQDNYTDHPIYRSRLASFVITGITTRYSTRRKGYDFFGDNSMSRKIIWRIIEEFKQEVTEEGARFFIVHLATKKPIKRLMKGKPLKYQNLLENLQTNFELIVPSSALVHQAEMSSFEDLFSTTGSHYSNVGYKVVGETVANTFLAP